MIHRVALQSSSLRRHETVAHTCACPQRLSGPAGPTKYKYENIGSRWITSRHSLDKTWNSGLGEQLCFRLKTPTDTASS
jgi:hypothetical protein